MTNQMTEAPWVWQWPTGQDIVKSLDGSYNTAEGSRTKDLNLRTSSKQFSKNCEIINRIVGKTPKWLNYGTSDNGVNRLLFISGNMVVLPGQICHTG